MLEGLSESEVDYYDLSLSCVIHNVFRLDIEVDHTSLVASMNDINNLIEHQTNKALGESLRGGVEKFEEVFTLDELEHLENVCVLELRRI